MKNVFFIIGIILSLIGAGLMIEGSLFGERTIGFATIFGIIAICLISTNSPHKLKKS